MTAYIDLHSLSENERIIAIANALPSGGKIAVVIDDEPAKVERYIKRVQFLCPSARVIEQHRDPTPGAYTVIFRSTKES